MIRTSQYTTPHPWRIVATLDPDFDDAFEADVACVGKAVSGQWISSDKGLWDTRGGDSDTGDLNKSIADRAQQGVTKPKPPTLAEIIQNEYEEQQRAARLEQQKRADLEWRAAEMERVIDVARKVSLHGLQLQYDEALIGCGDLLREAAALGLIDQRAKERLTEAELM